MFSPQEPEIKLKYANHKEEKKDTRPDSFAPYIHMEFSSCTIINFREEDVYSTKKGSQHVGLGGHPKGVLFTAGPCCQVAGQAFLLPCAEELAMLKALGTCMAVPLQWSSGHL